MQQPRFSVLATGYIRLHDNSEKTTHVRVLFDSGAESNLMEEQLIRSMNLKLCQSYMSIEGITGDTIPTMGVVDVKFSPWFEQNNEYSLRKPFFVLKTLPVMQRTDILNEVPAFKELLKADPHYHCAGKVQMVLGVDVWAEIVKGAVIKDKRGLCAENTTFGYVIYGSMEKIGPARSNVTKTCVVQTTAQEDLEGQLDCLIRNFWELEESTNVPSVSQADLRAEENFANTTRRDKSGRYVVTLPLIEQPQLGDSRAVAMNRFHQLERRLERNLELRDKYDDFMRQFIELNHMRLATRAEIKQDGYHIPHHPITKRFRVVFDAGCPSTNGLSVNDIQLSGPNLQEELPIILIRFRMHRYVLSADIKKMFRQIKMSAEHLKYHKIFWRFHRNEPIKEYVLLTVTYGMKSSPYLAIRTMLQIARDYEGKYPLASQATVTQRYMDDYMS